VQQCRAPLPFFGGSGHGGRAVRAVASPTSGHEKSRRRDAAAKGDGAALLRVACAGLLSIRSLRLRCGASQVSHTHGERCHLRSGTGCTDCDRYPFDDGAMQLGTAQRREAGSMVPPYSETPLADLKASPAAPPNPDSAPGALEVGPHQPIGVSRNRELRG
jgi:hypothetical protein